MNPQAAFALAALAFASPVAAQVRVVPEQPASAAAAADGVDIYFVNEGDAAEPATPPARITVTAADGTRLTLDRAPGAAPTIAPGGFAKLRYVPAQAVAKAPPRGSAAAAETTMLSSTGASSGILDRFAPHEPTYGAFGLNDAGGKLQISFAFRPFEGTGALDGVRFAYTQTMFWAVDEPSGPFRATIYSPELYYERAVGDDLVAAAGYRHDSNGRGGIASVDVNRIFIRASKRFDLGGDWQAELSPEAWLYVGKLSRQERIGDYWGYTGLGASIEQEDGLKVALHARGNPVTGKGSGELFVSYPLVDLGAGTGFYLFGQAFTGYGEALDDYRVADTHARLGIALTR
ncbi:phospholipase A [Stakelama marina]|uniref:Phospholipase A1 n=1 Tax=Stakelama marina TaxID=2826939 RepID=A0A8T4IF68_9SPHN|nr:phospholipase A [Stakelama marina]MBR0553203.1 phospholipase A [Stakelama marina]